MPSASDTVSLSPRKTASTCVCTKRLASTQNVSKASLCTTFRTCSCTNPWSAFVNGPASRVARSPIAASVSEITSWTFRAANTSSVSLVAIAC